MKRPSTVPVASRDRERAERAAKPRRKAVTFPKQDMASVVVLLGVTLLVLFAIAAPLRNYYEGRAEIARANEAIAQLEAQKAALERDIAMYEDEAFMKQEARRRLGVMQEGETAWRIVDPRMTASESITTAREDIPDTRPWPQVLWDSLREIPEPVLLDAPGSPTPSPQPPAPEEAPEGAPENAESLEEEIPSPDEPDR